uniref:Uncharacterized protein n=1 Tax=Magallana gigas TaxID=29159 RepID=K1Q9L5_MAGGI
MPAIYDARRSIALYSNHLVSANHHAILNHCPLVNFLLQVILRFWEILPYMYVHHEPSVNISNTHANA